MPKIVSVFGGAKPQPETQPYEDARRLGKTLAAAGWTVATGGYSGVMEAASRGAAEAGGHVIGVTCGAIEEWRGLRPNPWVQEEVKFATLRQRLYHLVEFCDATIALPGGIGTLSEVALTWSLIQTGEIKTKPLIVVGRLWSETVSTFIREADDYLHPGNAELIWMVTGVDEVVGRISDF